MCTLMRVTEAGLPKLICIITGKGNLKDFYLAKIKALALNHIDFITPWLQPEDYPRFLKLMLNYLCRISQTHSFFSVSLNDFVNSLMANCDSYGCYYQSLCLGF